jgi:hypothetical protein
MPQVGNKHFTYDKKGWQQYKEALASAAMKKKKKKKKAK